jgi:2-keto-4-pentenoate hydratase/2-oxohepta-3-ene-1,7-dioic acid hydratase in catechol pathway
VDYEGELGVVIGRRTHRATPAQAEESVLGFLCGNDVTARDLQRVDGQWSRAKGFDGFCPLGPWVATDVDPSDLLIETRVNGDIRQSARTSDMLFDPYTLVSFVSSVMTLVPGDVVLTGTPGGIGPLDVGDRVEVRIEGVGSLENDVVASGDGGSFAL